MTHELAHLNFGILRAPMDDPSVADFVAQLDAVNDLAKANSGFVWTPEGIEAGVGTAVFDHSRAMPNLSVWRSLEALRQFVYEGAHGAALGRRREWFEPARGPAYVLWWVPAGDRPSLTEGKRRLEHLAAHGPTSVAFTFTHPFAPPLPV